MASRAQAIFDFEKGKKYEGEFMKKSVFIFLSISTLSFAGGNTIIIPNNIQEFITWKSQKDSGGNANLADRFAREECVRYFEMMDEKIKASNLTSSPPCVKSQSKDVGEAFNYDKDGNRIYWNPEGKQVK